MGLSTEHAKKYEKLDLDHAAQNLLRSLDAAVELELQRLERQLGTTIMSDLQQKGIELSPQTIEHMLCEFRKLMEGEGRETEHSDNEERRKEYLSLFNDVFKSHCR